MITAVVVVVALIAGSGAAPALKSALSLGDDGTYQFFYDTGKDAGSHSREESRGADGVVVGKYSYQDPLGDLRVVSYRADDFGYVAKGDVSVPGSPPGQFPSEEQPEKGGDSENSSSSDDPVPEKDEKEDKVTTDAPQANNEDYEDDVKAIKLQEPSFDGPPDGFPVGFFDQSFQGLRRLPEPTSAEDEGTTEKKEDNESSTASPDDKPEEEKKEDPAASAHFRGLFPFSNIDPHAVFNLYHQHPPSSGPHYNPVYVYSYQHPDSHGYYYTF